MCVTRCIRYSCGHTIAFRLSTCAGAFRATSAHGGPRALCGGARAAAAVGLTVRSKQRCGACGRKESEAGPEREFEAVPSAGVRSDFGAREEHEFRRLRPEKKSPRQQQQQWNSRKTEVRAEKATERKESPLGIEVTIEDLGTDSDESDEDAWAANDQGWLISNWSEGGEGKQFESWGEKLAAATAKSWTNLPPMTWSGGWDDDNNNNNNNNNNKRGDSHAPFASAWDSNWSSAKPDLETANFDSAWTTPAFERCYGEERENRRPARETSRARQASPSPLRDRKWNSARFQSHAQQMMRDYARDYKFGFPSMELRVV